MSVGEHGTVWWCGHMIFFSITWAHLYTCADPPLTDFVPQYDAVKGRAQARPECSTWQTDLKTLHKFPDLKAWPIVSLSIVRWAVHIKSDVSLFPTCHKIRVHQARAPRGPNSDVLIPVFCGPTLSACRLERMGCGGSHLLFSFLLEKHEKISFPVFQLVSWFIFIKLFYI